MYCQNCGSEIDQTASICPYCGQTNKTSEIIRNKDIKIQEMEKKIAELEQIIKERPKSTVRKNLFNQFQPWIFITPILFVIVFFVFFILLISLT
ncbi:MAG: zinc-ribbon domain-containing protein [Candidatus Hermodarchaeota archaeon]